jgi:hypothetical protein
LFNFTWPHLHFDIRHFILNEDCCDPYELHYIYVCRKLEDAQEVCQANWAEVIRKIEDGDDDVPMDF